MVVILEPGFETIVNWTFETNNGAFSGGQSSGWATEGTYSYKLQNNSGTFNDNDYCRVKQTITIPTGFKFMFDLNITMTIDLSSVYECRVKLDSTVIKTYSPTSNQILLGEVVDLTAYSGSHVLSFEIFKKVTGVPFTTTFSDFSFSIDNIVEGSANIYVNSSTGNDTNAGDSCTAGHPVLTFGKAYGLVASTGTIHVCNSGADFSGETITFTKGFGITVDGDGNCYLPVFT